ncbi:MAG: hypothetical protein EOP47_18000 [Sphingobacteriaceae bacterium]|nr:MAG: hypothetical protein EOP47_18000 [Sphingobacteriaceae bacterium]
MENFTKAHWVFYAFSLLLFCSMAAEKLGDFYPSLVFPSFSNAPDIRQTAKFPVAGIFGVTDDGKKVRIDEDKLLYNLYPKHQYYVLKTIALKINQRSYSIKQLAELKAYLVNSLKRLDMNKFKSLVIIQGDRSYNMSTGKVVDFIDPTYTNIQL